MNLQLAAIAANQSRAWPSRRTFAWIRRDGTPTPQLTVPATSAIVPLPACPELNAQENLWQFLRQNWLSNRIFTFPAHLNSSDS